MKIETNKEYRALINRHAPSSPTLKNCVFAFLVGGFLCFAAEWLVYLYIYIGAEEKDAYLFSTLSFILIASLATAIGFFDRIARHGGAGTLLPVTGFSNAVTSSAIDSRSEGYISGVGTKIFTVAGPVILYSTVGGVVLGIIYYFYLKFFS